MNDFDEAFELIGGILLAVTVLLIFLTWLESTLLTSNAPRSSRNPPPRSDDDQPPPE